LNGTRSGSPIRIDRGIWDPAGVGKAT